MQDTEIWLLTQVAKSLGIKEKWKERGYSQTANYVEMWCEAEIIGETTKEEGGIFSSNC